MTPHEANWLALSLVERLGPKTLQSLLEHFGDVETLFDASPEQITRSTGLHPELAQRIHVAREMPAVNRERQLVETHGVRLIALDDPDYPPLLREMHLPPPLLYGLGHCSFSTGTTLAVVGTRAHSRYGEKVTRDLIEQVARIDPEVMIISGLARGIDTIAHDHALACGLRTVAVMAGGLTRIYPPENRELARRMVTQGGLITEFHMTQSPRANHFPIRNRIISGLSAGVLVVEAGERSGALITAGFAQNYNRPVFAVPGNIDQPSHVGANRLIQTGQARLVCSGHDLMAELARSRQPRAEQMDWLAPAPAEPQSARVVQQGDKGRILESLSKGPLHPDDLADELLIPIEKLAGLLLELELSAEIYQTSGNQYVLT